MDCIYAGITSYNPDIERLKENIGSVLSQVQGLVIVDNGSKNVEAVKKAVLEFKHGTVLLIENGKNMGVAYALNQIMHAAFTEGGADWVLTLDQDTVVYDNLIEMYKEFYSEYRANASMHIASLTCLRRDRNYTEKNQNGAGMEGDTGEAFTFVRTCITSGNLVSVDAWRRVGGFDSRLFIDMVDDEFCMRLGEADYDIVRINRYGYLHELGENLKKVRVFGREKTIFAYSPMRKYYTARNVTYLCRRYGLGRKNEYVSYLHKRILGTILYEKHRLSGLRAYRNGIRDGKQMKIKQENHCIL